MLSLFKNKMAVMTILAILICAIGFIVYHFSPTFSATKLLWLVSAIGMFILYMFSPKMRKNLYYVAFWALFIYSFYIIVFKFAPDFTQIKIIWAGPIVGVLALLFGALKINDIMCEDAGNDRMQELSKIINKGAMTFLQKEYLIMAIALALVSVAVYKFIGLSVMVCFISGALTSAFAGFIGMSVSTKSNARTAAAASISLNKAFKISYSGGLVMGLAVTGLALIVLPVLYSIYKDPAIISGFALGASLVALFARVGGGIFTKAADIGADLVGKVEENIPEDDPRNPAVIADNVGDNVGDVAGMGADLFESYVGTIVAAITLGAQSLNLIGAFMPLTLAAMGILSTIVASLFVKTKENGNPTTSLQIGNVIAVLLFTGSAYYLIDKVFMPGYTGIFYAVLTGIVAGCLIGFITQYYTGAKFPPVKSIVKSTETGAATTVISGFRVGMMSTFLPILIIAFSMIFAFWIIGGMESYNAGMYGISLAAIGMLATVGMIIAVDAYGPIADNAGGIAQMAGMAPEVRQRTDKLDAAGNTTAAIGKGFAIGSAALTAVTLLASYALTVNLEEMDVLNPFVMSAVVFGGCLPFFFCGLSMGAVGKAAEKMINEVRRQFSANPKILTGEEAPDYNQCIKISAKSAILSMLLPAAVAIIAPLFVGFVTAGLFGKTNGAQALGGLLIGAIASGVCLAIMMSNSGGAWDNAKKAIEEGQEGGKGSSCHQCAVIGDTIGDPLKDTSGPSLNILIKLMTITALVCATLFIAD